MNLPPPPVEPQAAPLHSLLERCLALPPEYRDGLTNHLPMALQALHAMGGTPAQLQRFHDGYAVRFRALADSPRAGLALTSKWEAPADWLALRGGVNSFAPLRAYFARWLAHDGAEAVLRAALPALLPGVAAAAFHGAIRAAHALQAGHAGELAAALAYWGWRWQPLAPAAVLAEPLGFEDWSAQLVTQATQWRSTAPLISLRMADATASAPYQALAAALRPAAPAQRLRELAGLAATRYLATGSFTVLHLVTGLRALRVLLHRVDAPEAWLPVLERAATAAYLAAHVHTLPPPPPVPATTWEDVVRQALDAQDDHAIKLVHACVQEARVCGEGCYLRVAALALAYQ